MWTAIKSMFWPDAERRNEPERQKQARKLEMDEPMAGAGAQLSGERNPSETERALKRATKQTR